MVHDDEQESPYQEQILQHARAPHGYATSFPNATAVTVVNPLCGDEVTMLRRWSDQNTLELRFHAKACLLCKASASILCSSLDGCNLTRARQIAETFPRVFTATADSFAQLSALLSGDLRALCDLRRYPTRERCVLLPWEAFSQLLYNQ